jgi:hypothetical protein
MTSVFGGLAKKLLHACALSCADEFFRPAVFSRRVCNQLLIALEGCGRTVQNVGEVFNRSFPVSIPLSLSLSVCLSFPSSHILIIEVFGTLAGWVPKFEYCSECFILFTDVFERL